MAGQSDRTVRRVGAVDRFELDPSSRLSSDGRVLFGGSPLSMFRLSTAGAALLERVSTGQPLPSGHQALTSRLVSAGALHPLPEPGAGPTERDVTLVIPYYNADPERVRALWASADFARVIVVDDASPTPFPEIVGVDVLRLESNGGPAVARQRGLELVDTPFVAFLDADVTAPEGWMKPLLPHFTDGAVALVAPRVRAADSNDRDTAIAQACARFEGLRGPLDLGPRRARIRAASRVSYVPAAALVARSEALRRAGGFDTALRLGEDVDLVWRLDESGATCRYEPSSEVHHEVRHTLGAWLRQRSGYGFSATDLAQRHPGAVAPVQTSAWSALAWSAVAAGAPLAGACIAGGTTAALVRKFPDLPNRAIEAARLAGLGNLHAGRVLATAATRSWWPASLALALVSRRARRALLLAVVVPTALEWWPSRRKMDPFTFALLRLLDDCAYGFGLWRGAVARRSGAALLPDLTSWPNRPRYARFRDARIATSGTSGQQ